MGRSRRNPKLSHRPRRSLLLVEPLESRRLLNGSSFPAFPWQSPPPAVSLADQQANGLLTGYALPGAVAGQTMSNLASQGWQGPSQLPAILGFPYNPVAKMVCVPPQQ